MNECAHALLNISVYISLGVSVKTILNRKKKSDLSYSRETLSPSLHIILSSLYIKYKLMNIFYLIFSIYLLTTLFVTFIIYKKELISLSHKVKLNLN